MPLNQFHALDLQNGFVKTIPSLGFTQRPSIFQFFNYKQFRSDGKKIPIHS